jgi:oxaloacetate decarboxylase gamma subunit
MEMLEQSGVLSMLGMGIVFGFLIILVIAITLIGKIMNALGLNKDSGAAKTGSPAHTGNSAQVTAAISAAVSEYTKSTK